MANRNSNANATSSATAMIDPLPFYKQHSWLYGAAEQDPDAIFAAEVMDLARGARTIAGILQAHRIDLGAIDSGNTDVRPLLSENDMESLARLAMVSLDKLADMASAKVDGFNRGARNGAKA